MGKLALVVDRARLSRLLEAELATYAERHPASRRISERAAASLVGGVPMPWMRRWAGGFPLWGTGARGAEVIDADALAYADLCLGDTGAMTGHAPPAVLEALTAQLARGLTTMLPTEDAPAAAEELARRFGLPRWLFNLTATDANRTAIRLARQLTGRPVIVVFSYCYHGSVDEAFAVAGPGGATLARAGNVGAPVDVALTTRAVEWNDAEALAGALAPGDVACVLAEPAMTNMGIILPAPAYHERLRSLTREAGTLLILDETHTLSAGPGGCTAAWELSPDLVTVGKAIGSGVPAGALGLSAAVERAMWEQPDADYEDAGGVGGTLAGNALSLAAVRATLEHVLTEAFYARAIPLAARWAAGVREVIAACGVPWHVTELGCRAEYAFTPSPAPNGTEAHAAADPELERFLHLHALNRGVLLTPFHNMALMSATTTEAAVDRHTEVFGDAVGALVGGSGA